MAKKDRLKSLLGAITETPIQEQPQQQEQPQEGVQGSTPEEDYRVASEVVQELGISPEMEEQLNEIRRARVGRPKGRKSGNPKPREERATFIVDKALTRKLKYIALMETKLYKNIISEALSGYIERWESKNGTINLPNTEQQ